MVPKFTSGTWIYSKGASHTKLGWVQFFYVATSRATGMDIETFQVASYSRNLIVLSFGNVIGYIRGMQGNPTLLVE